MDPATLLGIVLALVGLLIMMILEGSSPMAIVLPAPMILIFLGTFGAAISGVALDDAKRLPKWFKDSLFPPKPPSAQERIEVLVGLANQARKEGLLALQDASKSLDDPFLRRGLSLVIDGMDSEDLRDILEAEIASKRAEDKVAVKFFTAMGGYAPTIGIIGTVVGLIHVLENLDKPESLGPLIAGAFCATLWGVLTANILWLPMAAKLTRLTDMQCASMEMQVAGIVEIQAGANPSAVRQKLTALLPPSAAVHEEAA